MMRLARAIAVVVGIAVAAVAAHLGLIEVGREVAVLRTPLPNGEWYTSRLWIVDDAGGSWLHSAGGKWQERFAGDPIVEVIRDGVPRRYRARIVPGPHPRVDQLLREKYGLADRWVRFLAPCGPETLPVRLEPIQP